MKNLKLPLFLFLLLFIGITNALAQKKSTIIVTGTNFLPRQKFEIEIVNDDYSVEIKELNIKTNPFFAAVKREADVWLDQGYKIASVTTNTIGSSGERLLFVLIKEE